MDASPGFTFPSFFSLWIPVDIHYCTAWDRYAQRATVVLLMDEVLSYSPSRGNRDPFRPQTPQHLVTLAGPELHLKSAQKIIGHGGKFAWCTPLYYGCRVV